MTEQRRATVVGAGVTGLTTALRLARDGWRVRVLTADLPAATTSAVAAAVWYPYLVGPADAVQRWGLETAAHLAELARTDSAGVRARTMHELSRAPVDDPGWRTAMPELRREDGSLPAGLRDGWRYTSWVAEMPLYLRWLVDLLDEHDVDLVEQRVSSLDAAWTEDTDLVVDATGVEARALTDDPRLEPVAGQVVLVDAPWVTDVWVDSDGPDGATYLIPRTTTLVCGGTADRGLGDRTPDAATTAGILERCDRLVPGIADATVLDVVVGLRPSRPEVRLELEPTARGPVLHHYGHGGAGVTLSWGAAGAATELARSSQR